MPEPLVPKMGFGMNVACTLCRRAISRTSVAERHHPYRHRQRVGVAHVDLVLARRDLVVAALDDRAHRRHRGHRLWRSSVPRSSSIMSK
jgi:hypothetical protein